MLRYTSMTIDQIEEDAITSFKKTTGAKAFLNKSTFPIDQSLFIPVALRKNHQIKTHKIIFNKG